MRWIGQHIYDNISRFRNDVYLEDLSTTTETSALVVDSNGKISKNVTSGVNLLNGADNRVVTAVGTNGLQAEPNFLYEFDSGISTLSLLSTDSADFFSIATAEHGATTLTTVDDAAAAANFEIAADGDIILDSAGQIKLEPASGNNILLDGAVAVDASAVSGLTSLTCTGANLEIFAFGNSVITSTNDFTIFSAASEKPLVEIKSTTNDDKGSTLQFTSDKGGAGADGDKIGTILFVGDDDAQNQHSFAKIVGSVSESANASEAGKLEFFVSESDGETPALTAGLTIEGEHNVDGEIDVTIAAGAASTTTIAGTLTMGSTAALTNAGLVAVANQSNITGVGTITSGVWNGTAITASYIAAAQTNITSLGTLANLRVDYITINDKSITITGDTDDTCAITTGAAGATTITTTDDAAAAGHFEVAADGDIILDANGQIKLEPVAGNNILLDGTVAVDAGVITGVTSLGGYNIGQRGYFEFSGYATADGSNFMYSDIMSGTRAPFLHDETAIGSAGTTADNPAAFLRANGTVMPYAGTLKMWKGWGASAGSATIDVSIFKYTPTADDDSNDSLVLVKNTQFTAAGNDNLKTWSETSFSITVAAGDILISAIKGGTNNKAAYFVSTLEIEWTS